MRLKRGVAIEKLSAAAWRAVPVAESCFDAFESILVITSGHEGFRGDGIHSDGSLHYVTEEKPSGNAFDCRTRHLNKRTIDRVVGLLRKKLGRKFDVVKKMGSHMHIHVEFDPK